MSQPLVSVVMPVRNGGRYLATAVNSILGQTLTSLELILIDDHSTDRAIQALERSDERLKIFENPGSGIIDACNHGFFLAKGSYLARMDADDVSLPERLARQVALLERESTVDIAGARVRFIPQERIRGGFRHYQDWLNSVCTPEQIRRQLFIECPIPNPTAMFRRAALDLLGGYQDHGWPEDYDLFLRADLAGLKMAKPETVLFEWREHDRRLTHTDSRYERDRFQQAKAHYLVRGRLPDGPLILWGAGPGGRLFHDLLQNEGREANGFIDIHPRRIGRQKRGKPVWDAHDPAAWPAAFIVVAVGARGARAEIRAALAATGRREGKDFVLVA